MKERTQEDIHTSMPGRVTAYNPITQVASVQLLIQLVDETIPPLDDVPVMWPGGAAGFLHVPLAEGDNVLVVFSEEDFSTWLDTDSISPPALLQRHGLHAIAVPGLSRPKDPKATTGGHVTLAATSELRLGADGAADAVSLASMVDAHLETIRTTWIVNTAMGPSSTAAVAGATSLTTVASSKVKTE